MPGPGEPIRMYGVPAELPPPPWSLVEQRLADAPLYWVSAASDGWPHPRPVWGVWHRDRLCMSVGSPVLRRSIIEDGRVTVHPESGTEVVVVEGHRVETEDASAVDIYNRKYDYDYDVAAYGPLLVIEPSRVLAWTAAGPAGRDGFRTGATWSFPLPGEQPDPTGS